MINNSTDVIDEPSVLPVNQSSASPTKITATAKERLAKHKNGHFTQLPLSRNTSKLTLSGNEMVDAYESALEYSSSTESLHKSTSNTCSGYFGSDTVTDSEKTPTNLDKNKSFIYSRALSQSQATSHETETDTANHFEKETNTQNKENSSLTEIKDSDSSDDLYEDCINEAINFMVNVPEALQPKKNSSLQKLITISERKRLQSAETDEVKSKNDDLKSESTKADQKLTPTSLLVLPEISRLKPHHRPLSASSISSTTSSSSSGSEHLTNKLGVSYLASVESLADHSENESSSNPSLTLCERACMEIIDSERSYVDDLGQVIEG